MHTSYGDLTYCTNIHAGESWDEHFAALKQNVPYIKTRICPDKPFGIGLRLSNQASIQLTQKDALHKLIAWLQQEECYVFTMNGFPYGGFHHTVVKDQVHAPDWTTPERISYTKRLLDILAVLLPATMEGGISTSPLSYKHWHPDHGRETVILAATHSILQVVEYCMELYATTGKLLHLDIEPEPDGLLESGPEFIAWYEQYLIPQGVAYFHKRIGQAAEKTIQTIKDHVRLCYDVCHFAVGYEDHQTVIRSLRDKNIRTGKIQISAALKARIPKGIADQEAVRLAFAQFAEPTYLHQVVALQHDDTLRRYNDLPEALGDKDNALAAEWRSHFHVPLFIQDYGVLKSTQEDIRQVLSLHKQQPFAPHLEVETYTWEVLPDALKLPLSESIIREMDWVTNYLNVAD